MKNDVLKWGALVAALVATASAEYELARAVGFNQYVAAAVPAALDLYTVRALRAHKEVLAAVAAMIGVNAASHLVTTGLLPVNVWLVVAVAAIAPLVLWRVHSLGTGHEEPSNRVAEDTVAVPEVTAPVTVERADDDQPRALPEAPKVVPAGVRMLPIVARPEPETTFAFDHSRQQYMPSGSTNGYIDWPTPEEPKPPVLGPFFTLPQAPATPVALLSVADVAQARGVAEGTVRSWVARDKLTPAQRDPDGRLLFHPDAVAALN